MKFEALKGEPVSKKEKAVMYVPIGIYPIPCSIRVLLSSRQYAESDSWVWIEDMLRMYYHHPEAVVPDRALAHPCG